MNSTIKTQTRSRSHSVGIVAKIYNLISIKALRCGTDASMQRSNKLLRLFIALFINEKWNRVEEENKYNKLCVYRYVGETSRRENSLNL